MSESKLCAFCARRRDSGREVTLYAAADVRRTKTGFKEYTTTYHDLQPLTMWLCRACRTRLRVKAIALPLCVAPLPFLYAILVGRPVLGWSLTEALRMVVIGVGLASMVVVVRAERVFDADYAFAREMTRRGAGPAFMSKATVERMRRADAR